MVTMVDVKAILDPDEPHYGRIRDLGPDALEYLEVLTDSGDEMLASKATYAASLLADDQGADLVERAAASDDEVVRVAAAAGLRNLGATRASKLAAALAADADEGVSKTAQLSAVAHPSSEVSDAAGLSGEAARAKDASTMPEPTVVSGMPEEAAGGQPMPGEIVENETQAETGLMPGETPDTNSSDRSGLMPGETDTSD